eukprot:5862453-Alexandrium_andersonii.AAC.1
MHGQSGTIEVHKGCCPQAVNTGCPPSKGSLLKVMPVGTASCELDPLAACGRRQQVLLHPTMPEATDAWTHARDPYCS